MPRGFYGDNKYSLKESARLTFSQQEARSHFLNCALKKSLHESGVGGVVVVVGSPMLLLQDTTSQKLSTKFILLTRILAFLV